MQRRSTTILLIGALTLVLGAAVTFAAVRGPKRAAAAPTQLRTAQPGAGEPGGFTIPEGKQAIAVALDPVAGTGGVARAGDHVNVFAAVTTKDDKGVSEHAARMVIQGVEVLRIGPGGLNPVAAATDKDVTNAPNGTTLFVLAVTPTQAEKIVFHGSFSKLWFTVVPAGQKPVAPTPGVHVGNQLQPEAA